MTALVAKGLLAELDRSRLANFGHLDAKFLCLPFDRENRFSVPYFWARWPSAFGPTLSRARPTGLAVLFDPRDRGRITMLDDMENVVAAVLGYLGFPLNSLDPRHLEAAQRLLIEQKPLVQAYTSDSYRERLIAGEAWASLGWSGDLLQAASELAKVDASKNAPRRRPRAGHHSARRHNDLDRQHGHSESFAKQGARARLHRLLAGSSGGGAEWRKVNYATPNEAARLLLPPAMLADESIYPPAELLARCSWLENRGPAIEKIERLWRVVRVSSALPRRGSPNQPVPTQPSPGRAPSGRRSLPSGAWCWQSDRLSGAVRAPPAPGNGPGRGASCRGR